MTRREQLEQQIAQTRAKIEEIMAEGKATDHMMLPSLEDHLSRLLRKLDAA
jgi:hypothetical protein